MDLLAHYIEKFEKLDGGKFEKFFDEKSDIGAFLSENLPLFRCSDKMIEEIYYFRAYTFAKHIKKNRNDKFIVTEWLDSASWQKETDGAISCPVGHQLSELKWFKNGKQIAEEYIRFWSDHPRELFYYNNWFVYAVWDYCKTTDNMDFAYSLVPLLVEFFELVRAEHKSYSGLYKSVDNYDGMELSISGHGIRPTINSYVYANAYGLYKILEYGGDTERAEDYKKFASSLRERINENLFKKDFYYNLPLENGEEIARLIPEFANPNQKYGVKELIGYVPFYFDIPTEREEVAWKYLMNPNVFLSPYGLTTADKSEKQFGFEFSHMCLWNGPVWPFATSQVLTGLARTLQKENKRKLPINDKDFCKLLKTYAKSQYIKRENGEKRPWIDENLDGETGEWIARKWLYEHNREDKDRGRDYNHSTFIDLVLGGLCGAQVVDGEVKFSPVINAEEIAYFSVQGLKILGKTYNVKFDETGFSTEEA